MADILAIPLNQGKVAIIDAADANLVEGYKWRVLKTGRHQFCWYAQASIKRADGRWTTLYMHRLLLGIPNGQRVDHKDGDGLNNRRDNLRLATHAQNMQNQRRQVRCKTTYKGVSYHHDPSRKRPWQAYVKHQQKLYSLRYYATDEEAARAYDRKAMELFGEYASLNFPKQGGE